VKRKATEDISSRPAKVIKNELFASIEENLKPSDITSLRQALYRERNCIQLSEEFGATFKCSVRYISETSPQRNFKFVGELTALWKENRVKRKATEDISSRPAKVIKNELFASIEENLKPSDITSLRQALYCLFKVGRYQMAYIQICLNFCIVVVLSDIQFARPSCIDIHVYSYLK
jgi:hypothetical protein